MFFYALTSNVSLTTQRMFKWIPGVKDLSKVPATALYTATPSEIKMIAKYLEESEGKDAAQDHLHVFSQKEVSGWRNFSLRLGRHSLGIKGPGREHMHDNEREPLISQLRYMVQCKPDRPHFRIFVVNGFGVNIGDNLLGTTALRHMVRKLHDVLPSFSLDILLPYTSPPGVEDLFRTIDEVDQIVYTGPNLSEFGRYDAYIDFSDLIKLPGYATMPAVDFYLWWMGLDPRLVAEKEKRNHISIPYQAWSTVGRMLSPLNGRKILLSHRASVALRSMPVEVAGNLAGSLLEQHKDLSIVVDHGLDLTHPRLLDLDGHIDDVDKLKALVAQVDGMIAVDSLPFHLADATATPVVMLSASIPPEHFPYYPHALGRVPEGMSALPGWGKTKLDSGQWEVSAKEYLQVWSTVAAEDVWRDLSDLMARKNSFLEDAPPQIDFASRNAAKPLCREVRQADGSLLLKHPHEIRSEVWLKTEVRIIEIVRQMVVRGSAVIQAGAGNGEITLFLARCVGPEGRVAVFEPRRLYFQTLCANAMLAGLDTIHAYPCLPVHIPEGAMSPEITDLDLRSPHDVRMTGNMHTHIPIETRAIDGLGWPACRMLIVQPPMPVIETLESAGKLLADARPIVVIAPCKRGHLADLHGVMHETKYHLWFFDMSSPFSEGDAAVFILALPAENNVRPSGFTAYNEQQGKGV